MNTNFQTIHQMGSAISDFVKQATGRDSVQNIDMDHVTVAQNHVYEEVDISGRVVRFNAGEAGSPFEKLLVQIKPVQEGSGDPSPENVRPITGWTMVNLYRAGQNLEDAQVFRFPFPSEAGVVYGGTLDVVTGELVVDRKYAQMLSSFINSRDSNSIGFYGNVSQVGGNAVWVRNWNYTDYPKIISGGIKAVCNAFPVSMHNRTINASQYRIYFGVGSITTLNEFKEAVEALEASGSGLFLCYELAAPITYQLTPQEITTLLGQNNIWADTGDTEVKFTNLKELY